MPKGTLVILGREPLDSLADRLDLLLRPGMAIAIVDGVHDAIAADRDSSRSRKIMSFIEANRPLISIKPTDAGRLFRVNRDAGGPSRRNAPDVAVADFLSSGGGIWKLVASRDQVVLLHEGMDLFISRRPANLHAVSTTEFIRGLERAGFIESDAIIGELTHPAGVSGAGESTRFTEIWQPGSWIPGRHDR